MKTTTEKEHDMGLKVGDRVEPLPRTGTVFIVEKVNPRKNVRCSAEDGSRGINWPAELLVPATDEAVDAGRRR
jgi:hypothetical protein